MGDITIVEEHMPMLEAISITCSILALCVSIATAWVTLFRRGRLLMTQPGVIFVGFDGVERTPKFVVRAMLCSSGHRGFIVETMFANVSNGQRTEAFSFWGYSPGPGTAVVRGSGLFVGVQGDASYHHFVLPKSIGDWTFPVGGYSIEIVAKILGEPAQITLGAYSLEINRDVAEILEQQRGDALYDWLPDKRIYVPDVRLSTARHPE